ncbi:hypothetical protein KSU1_C1617 [Candidatus Jettenia caeni]|uniref:Uncharacterized protein n=1 Tax=Candidatus Jettenia caeni TaxID=247490 RepID=I3INB8_9BACT|nr:hypothetical protein KSU1_C1617 [Candidatus Jettenia caeni]GIL19222.1 MAG: hypothetical protein BroJett041_03360 [Candidatus Jettenia caeni]GJQ45765.1 MAG: hypothetical protein JETCAE04_15190 [Candidatus Jettenia caeni]
MVVSMPRVDKREEMSMTDIAMLKSPKSLTLNSLEIMSTAKNPRPAAKIFPVNIKVRRFIIPDLIRSLVLEIFMRTNIPFKSFSYQSKFV